LSAPVSTSTPDDINIIFNRNSAFPWATASAAFFRYFIYIPE